MACLIPCTGCKETRKWRVSLPADPATSPPRTPGVPFLFISTESACLERVCCGPNRAMTHMIHNGPTAQADVVGNMIKPFHCMRYPCMRPQMQVTGKGGPTDSVGFVNDPFDCVHGMTFCTLPTLFGCLCFAEMNQGIHNKDQAEIYKTKMKQCQAGFCCPLCFDINAPVMKGDQEVARVTKAKMNLCCNKSRYGIDFKDVKHPDERRLVLAQTLLMNDEYFDCSGPGACAGC